MAGRSGCSSTVPSLPPPCPRSPPEYPDLYGKRREAARVQMLEREIRFLEEELKSVNSLQPASRSCKEVTDFVVANSDPLILTTQKKRKSRRFWKWLSGWSCFSFSWICCCCYSLCPLSLETPCCCCDCGSCCSCKCPPCFQCSIPKPRCSFRFPSCLTSNCCRWRCCWPKCPKVKTDCFSCKGTCCSCNLCYTCY
ncbi:hypothetical protein CRG98_036097 [Punica granatum]|uniref:G protein gamma domain-containing protein n=1 Tax=Punica granatum TaxID=22663 RepID=A0A2I0IHM6_PUNGR|nr:hypothetical protein CRG98_036097 [Punica granatum]